MKKIFILVSLLVCAVTALHAEQLSTNKMVPAPPHVEFKYYGFYASVDYTFMMPLNKVTFELENHNTVDHYFLNGVTAVAGFQWRKESSLGVGFSYLADPNNSFSQIPIFVEYRSYYLRSRVSPFSTLQLGYSMPIGVANPGPDYIKINKGGLTVGVSVGGRVAFTRNLGLNLWVGYQMIQIRELERGFDGDPSTRLPELYHNLKGGIGLSF